jgi:hypothetical protein
MTNIIAKMKSTTKLTIVKLQTALDFFVYPSLLYLKNIQSPTAPGIINQLPKKIHARFILFYHSLYLGHYPSFQHKPTPTQSRSPPK